MVFTEVYFLHIRDIKCLLSQKNEDCDYLSLGGNLLVKAIAKEKYFLDNIEITALPSGKPFFKNCDNLHFNITHSKNSVFVVFDDNPIGIDCEKIRKINLSHCYKIFTESEIEYINSKKHNKNTRFLEMWTKKEAYSKLLGKNIFSLIKSRDEILYNSITIKYKKYILSVSSKKDISNLKILSGKKILKKFLTNNSF